jgi:hypothetical protein
LAQERDPKRLKEKKKQKQIEDERAWDRHHPWSPTRRRRHRNATRKAAAQRKRMESREKEMPEAPQPPAKDTPQLGQSLVMRNDRYNLMPEVVREQIETLAEEITQQLGGPTEISPVKRQLIRRLAQVDAVVDLFLGDLTVRGLLTTKGKVRSSVESLKKYIDLQEKLSKLLGLDRTTKTVPMTIDQFMDEPDAD